MTIAREALPFVLALALAAALSLVFLPAGWASIFLPPLAFTLWFFRDPRRSTPTDASLLISPADGKIIRAGAGRISIFMNVFDVHVCRSPAAGVVESVKHSPGRFLAAFKDEASECNERVAIVVRGPFGPVRFTLVAGLVARRIVCKVEAGRGLQAGERVGLIRFGSRVDVDLPEGARPDVRVGDRVVSGETPIARRTQLAANPAVRVE